MRMVVKFANARNAQCSMIAPKIVPMGTIRMIKGVLFVNANVSGGVLFDVGGGNFFLNHLIVFESFFLNSLENTRW